MRILLVHHAYPPGSSGGSEIYTESLARRLSRDHEVAVLHRSADPSRPDHDLLETQRDGVRVFSLNNLHRKVEGFEAYRDPVAAEVSALLIEKLRPELVHVGHLTGLSTGLVFAACDRKVAVVVTLHDFWTVCPLGQLLDVRLRVCPGPTPRRCLGCVGGQVAVRSPSARALGRRLPLASAVGGLLARAGRAGERRITRRLAEMHEVLRAADVLISPSVFLKGRLSALGVSGIDVLPNGRDSPASSPRVPDPGGRTRFGLIGAAIPSKGVHVLAEAFRSLADPRAALRIHGPFLPYHGDFGYEARVRGILGPAADESLRGPFAHERLGDVLAGLDVLVVPSLWEENAPLVVQEAFQAHLPLVVSDHGGLAEQVREDVDGLRFRPGDAADLARVLRRLLDDPGLLARLGSDPPGVPCMDEHVVALEGLYERAVARRGSRAGRVGVVVVDHGRPEDAKRAVTSARSDGIASHVVVVENAPEPRSSLSSDVERLSLPANLGYAAGANAGIERCREAGCDRFVLLNNDVQLEKGCLRRLAEGLEDPELGAVGPVIRRAGDGRVESRGIKLDLRLGRLRLLGHGEAHRPAEGRLAVSSLSGAVMALSAHALERVGSLDETYFHGFEDADWCTRARHAELELAVIEGAVARHVGEQTLGKGSPVGLYYAARNHLRAVEGLCPLRGPRAWLRRGAIVSLNVAHALLRGPGPRGPRLRAVAAGTADFLRGRSGPRAEVS